MARIALTKTNAALNDGAAISETDIATVIGTVGASLVAGVDESIVIYAENTAGTSQTLTVKAGAYDSAGLGDLEVALAQNAPKVIGPLEGMRFAQADGKVYIDVTTGATGVIAALNLDF